MLDFSVEASRESEEWVLGSLRLLGCRGLLIQSGRSYHYYGAELFGALEMRDFLAKALLFGGLVDRRWVAHQLIEGCCGSGLVEGTAMQCVSLHRCEEDVVGA